MRKTDLQPLTRTMVASLANAWPPGSNMATCPAPTITLHGCASSRDFWRGQNFIFGNGQSAELPAFNADFRSAPFAICRFQLPDTPGERLLDECLQQAVF